MDKRLNGWSKSKEASEAYVMLNGIQHKAMTDQITTVSKKRITNRMGTLLQSDLHALERAIKVQLGLS